MWEDPGGREVWQQINPWVRTRLVCPECPHILWQGALHGVCERDREKWGLEIGKDKTKHSILRHKVGLLGMVPCRAGSWT